MNERQKEQIYFKEKLSFNLKYLMQSGAGRQAEDSRSHERDWHWEPCARPEPGSQNYGIFVLQKSPESDSELPQVTQEVREKLGLEPTGPHLFDTHTHSPPKATR